MPLTHVILDGERYSLDEVQEVVANRESGQKYTPELLASILDTRQERDYISTTALTGKCMRQKALERYTDYTADIDGMWAAWYGTMFHGQLEKFVQPGAVEEARFVSHRYMLDYDEPLSGSPDLLSVTHGILYDYKTNKENPRFNYPWPDHVEQVNINRWLVDYADEVQWRCWAFTEDHAPQRLDKRNAWGDPPEEFEHPSDFRPKDWQELVLVYMDKLGVKSIACTKSIQIPKKSGGGTKAARVADVWSDEKVEALLDEKFPAAHDALTLGNIPPQPPGFEHAGHVLCNYCDVKAECLQLEHDGF